MAALELNGRHRVVVLGASNVSRGLAGLAAVLRARAGGPVDLFLAAGHGRGYGVSSRVWMRRLPSILGCGLWDAMRGEPLEADAPPVALVTDVGNEILYGCRVEQVAAWVRESVRRLVGLGCRVAITRLPLASIAGVGEARLMLLRTVFVPRCRLTLGDLKDAAARLDADVRDIAGDFGAEVVEQPAAWYGFDAIHVRRRRLDELWQAACDAWGWSRAPVTPRPTVGDWAALHGRAAEVRGLGRIMLHTRQPTISRPDFRVWMH